MLGLLFSFRGRIQRLAFFIGGLIRWIFLWAICLVLAIFYSKIVFRVIDPTRLNAKLHAYQALWEQVNFSIISSDHDMQIFAIIMIPVFVVCLLPLWSILTLYIKRFRDIGVAWPITLILLALPYILIGLLIGLNLSYRDQLNNVGRDTQYIWYIPGLVALFTHFLIPQFWPSKKS